MLFPSSLLNGNVSLVSLFGNSEDLFGDVVSCLFIQQTSCSLCTCSQRLLYCRPNVWKMRNWNTCVYYHKTIDFLFVHVGIPFVFDVWSPGRLLHSKRICGYTSQEQQPNGYFMVSCLSVMFTNSQLFVLDVFQQSLQAGFMAVQ